MKAQHRIAIAKEKIETVINALRTLQQVRANNELMLYSAALRKQVGTSYAANAYNVLCGALYESELVRVCALWDSAANERQALDRNSIPAISWLIAPNEVAEILRAERVSDRSMGEENLSSPPSNPERRAAILEWLRQMRLRRAEEEGEKVIERFESAKTKIQKIQKSELLVNIKNFRDKHIAHSLVQTTIERRQGDVEAPKYGHEKELLDLSIDAISDLYFVVCDSSYAWEMAWEHSHRYATALLSKCTFNVVE